MQIEHISLFLFLPANRLDRLEKAVATAAGAVILDLEDAVSPDQKEAARDGLDGALDSAAARKCIIVRVNGAETDWHEGDARAVRQLPVAAVVLPKAESGEQCKSLASQCGKPVIALIETAKGVFNASDIAHSADRLAFGNLDFAADIGAEQDHIALSSARFALVIASRVAGIAPPIDGVTPEFNDPAKLAADVAHSRKMGFGGKLLIHPTQIEPARRGFMPTESDILWARNILAATNDVSGVTTVDGQMIDAPVIKRATQIIARTEY